MPFRGGCGRAQKDTWCWQGGSKCPSFPCCPISVPALVKGACALLSRREQVPPAPLLAGGRSGPCWSLSISEALDSGGVLNTHQFPNPKPFSSPVCSENTLQSLALSPGTTQSQTVIQGPLPGYQNSERCYALRECSGQLVPP